MKIKEIDSKLPGLRISIDNIEVDPAYLVEHAFFEKPYTHGTDYRTQSIDYFLKHKVDFHSTCNSIHKVAERFIVIKCPNCKSNMEVTSGGGTSSSHTTTYTCASCGTKASLTMPSEGFSVEFKGE